MCYTRIAPTPSGYLHLGNAYNFLLIQYLARKTGGDILLRIDDIDRDRYRPEYVQDILATLQWLGIEYQRGPRSVAEFESDWSQRLRAARYQELLDRLRAKGLVYACTHSRKDIQAMTTDGIYRGERRDETLSLDTPGVAWRLDLKNYRQIDFATSSHPLEIDLLQAMGHFVVRKKNGSAAYQLASLADDFDFGIQLIVRGEDLLASTAAQLHLAVCLGFKDFRRSVTFHHHPLLTDAAGEKLSKSAGAASLLAMRQSGIPPPRFSFNDVRE